jgi:NADPH:quinone reductase-like Zn-dependent oxidoreductase
MKAFALTGPDEPAAVVDVPEPELADELARITIRAASVNGFDVFQASGYLVAMMEHRFPTVIGRDFSGVAETVGEGRTDVAVGDEVIGFVPSAPPLEVGTFAESLMAGPAVVLAPKPSGLAFDVAAAIPLAGATALGTVDAIKVSSGDTVLVVGATGGVGSFAVQLAAQRGARVIGTAKAGEEAAYLGSIGVTDTIDYGTDDVATVIRGRFPEGVDALIDVVDREEAFASMAALVRDGGHIATTLGAADVERLAARGIEATNVAGNPTTQNITALAEQVAAGTLRVAVRAFPLSEAPAALAAFGAGTRGKIVLEID